MKGIIPWIVSNASLLLNIKGRRPNMLLSAITLEGRENGKRHRMSKARIVFNNTLLRHSDIPFSF